jgi:glycolate oxidase
VLEAGERIQALCIAAGGSLSGEHGIGYEKRDGLCHLFAQADLDAMGRLRDAFDPERRFNPGKLLPTRACLELHGLPVAHRPEGATDGARGA